jgi:hypothetical protein
MQLPTTSRRDPFVPPIAAATGVSDGAPFDPGYPSSIARVVQKLDDPPVRSERPDRKAGAFAFPGRVLPSLSTCPTARSLTDLRRETHRARHLACGDESKPKKSQSLCVSTGTPL